jgi:hypothetical protein
LCAVGECERDGLLTLTVTTAQWAAAKNNSPSIRHKRASRGNNGDYRGAGKIRAQDHQNWQAAEDARTLGSIPYAILDLEAGEEEC